jgi:ribokinase
MAAIGNANVDFSYKLRAFPQADHVVTAEGYEIGSGGSASNYAYAAARLGATSLFVGAVGDDVLGQFFLRELSREGVDVSLVQIVPNEKTGTVTIWVDEKGEKHGAAWRGANLKLNPTTEWNRLNEADIVHLSGCSPNVVRWVVSEINSEKSFDPGSASHLYTADDLLHAVSNCKLSFLSEAESSKLVTHSGRTLSELVSSKDAVIVEKMGAKGVRLHVQNRTLAVKPLQVAVKDTTGAGDVFSATFDYKFLLTRDVVEAVYWATASAALKVQSMGAKGGVPTFSELKRFFAENKHKFAEVEANVRGSS